MTDYTCVFQYGPYYTVIKKPTHIQVQSATVQPSQQASPQQQQTIIAQTQQQANLLQSPGQQLIWHNQRLYAIVPQGKIQ